MCFMVKLWVQNFNDELIEYNGIVFDFDVNGQFLVSGVSDQIGEVLCFGEWVVSVLLIVFVFFVFCQVWGLSNNVLIWGMFYVVKGKFVGGLFGIVCFSEKGIFDFFGLVVGVLKIKGF